MKRGNVFLLFILLIILSISTINCDSLKDKKNYEVNTEKCTGCGECQNVCPANAITIRNSKAYIDKDRCISCGRCEPTCPEDAIWKE